MEFGRAELQSFEMSSLSQNEREKRVLILKFEMGL